MTAFQDDHVLIQETCECCLTQHGRLQIRLCTVRWEEYPGRFRWYSYKRKAEGDFTREAHEMMERETGMLCLEEEGCTNERIQVEEENTRKLIFPIPPKGTNPTNTLTLAK